MDARPMKPTATTRPKPKPAAVALAAVVGLAIFAWLLRPDGSTNAAQQTPEQRDGGLAVERVQVQDYCTPLMWAKLNALPGVNTVEITAPTISFMGQRDGGNVYLQESVFKRGDTTASWRCQRFNGSKGWQDIEITLQNFQA